MQRRPEDGTSTLSAIGGTDQQGNGKVRAPDRYPVEWFLCPYVTLASDPPFWQAVPHAGGAEGRSAHRSERTTVPRGVGKAGMSEPLSIVRSRVRR